MKKIIKLFEQGNVCVTGLRGSGKDMLMSNVAVRRNIPYISNINYDSIKQNNYIKLDLKQFDLQNNCVNFIEEKINPYFYKYPDGIDIYLSDASVYFPNYQTLLLNKKYEGFVNFMALSRQVGECNFHINAQNLVRVWEKIPEQSDIYLYCNGVFYLRFFKLVFQKVTIYSKRISCENRIPPLPKPRFSLFSRSSINRQAYELQRLSYRAQHGDITTKYLFYFNKSNYDTRLFRKILEGGVDN